MLGTNQYSHEFIDGPDRGRLAVILSHCGKPAFRHFDYGCPTLFVWESRTTYYTRQALRAVSHLAQEVRKGGHRSVCFVGISKAGYGALLWSSLLAGMKPGLNCSAIAFSPQTVLYPANNRLRFSSYRKLIARSENNPDILSDLKKHGQIPYLSDYRNLRVKIFYPERVETDRLEALHCTGPNVELIALPIDTHVSVVPYIVDVTDRVALESKVASLFRAKTNDEDLLSFVKDDQFTKLVEEYQAIGRQPDLPTLVAEISGRKDSSRPTLMDRLKALFRKAA